MRVVIFVLGFWFVVFHVVFFALRTSDLNSYQSESCGFLDTVNLFKDNYDSIVDRAIHGPDMGNTILANSNNCFVPSK